MTPAVVRTVPAVREQLLRVRESGERIGLVPTMGALHAAHANLIERARAECDIVVISIFVNPLQFGPDEDYLRYPRNLERDLALCREQGADIVFAPEVEDMYPSPQLTFTEVQKISEPLCGFYRPGHFRGVATVVLKLFNIIQPASAYFGEKDYQQLCVIRRMVEDVNLPVRIIGIPTLRESDGLAMSSRNVYLEGSQRKSAGLLFKALSAARAMIEAGQRDAQTVKAEALRLLAEDPVIRLQYLEVIDSVEAQPISVIDAPVRVAGAVWVGKTRLIDNVPADPPSA